jgi:natural resistance-associated macrophage protein
LYTAILPAVVVALTATDFLDSLDQWLNVLQAVQLPFALVPVLLFTNSSAIMGKFSNPLIVQVVTWVLGLGVIAINIYSIIQAFEVLPQTWWLFAIFVCGGILYFAFIIFLIVFVYHAKLRRLLRGLGRPFGCCTSPDDDQPEEAQKVTSGYERT